ncbi:tail protein [Mycolicibacterium litorale]|uniref:Tail protein n=1 Tax=Mycolicibacterium litorale TaxID=758802 RepID=A0A6S6PE69_9MYCO|nr:hypothetical protein [Mycolicibacterium litorale]BCI54940.1 tail protein [Mycolicibacterium litorale]
MAFTGNVQNVILPSPKNLPAIGGLYAGPVGVTLPTQLTNVANTMKNLGFISDAGINETEDRPTTPYYAWGGDLAAESQDSFRLSIQFTLWEFLNPEVAKVSYGDNNVTVTAADATHGTRLSIAQTADVFEMKSWCWDAFAPGGKRIQKWFPLGQVKNKDSQPTNHREILAHTLTVVFFPDTAGKYSYTLTDDGVVDAS